MKNSNEERFQKLTQYYKEKYLNDYSMGFQKAQDKKYYEAVFKREVLEKNKSDIYNTNNFSDITHYRNEKSWLEGVQTADALDEYCKMNNRSQKEIYSRVAEYDAILSVWNEIDTRNLPPESLIKPSIQEISKRTPMSNQQFIINEKVLSKIDFIRIMNVLSELRAFKYEDGTYPPKKDVMEVFGEVVGIDLRQYSKDLSKAMKNSACETNLAIFKKMQDKMISIWSDRLDEA